MSGPMCPRRVLNVPRSASESLCIIFRLEKHEMCCDCAKVLFAADSLMTSYIYFAKVFSDLLI